MQSCILDASCSFCDNKWSLQVWHTTKQYLISCGKHRQASPGTQGGLTVARLPVLDEVAAELALRLVAKVHRLAGLLAVQLPAQIKLPAARSRTAIST